MKKGPWALKQSFKYAYNINQNRSYMQLPQTTLYKGSQGSSPGLPRGLFAPGAARRAPRSSPGAIRALGLYRLIEPRAQQCSRVNRLSPASPTTPLNRDQLELQGIQRRHADLQALDSTRGHRQALVNKSINIIPGRRNLVY